MVVEEDGGIQHQMTNGRHRVPGMAGTGMEAVLVSTRTSIFAEITFVFAEVNRETSSADWATKSHPFALLEAPGHKSTTTAISAERGNRLAAPPLTCGLFLFNKNRGTPGTTEFHRYASTRMS